jgi:iron uptake system component EfeO
MNLALVMVMGFIALCVGACGSGGEGSADANGGPRIGGIDGYRPALERDAASAVAEAEAMTREIEAGELQKAQFRYMMSRVPYGHLKPLSAEAFPALDARIDAYQGGAPASELGGFRQVEKALFERGATAGTASTAKALVTDLKTLERRVESADLEPATIAEVTAKALEEVPSSMVVEVVQPYANNDLVDVAANVEGAEAAFKAIEPRLAESNPTLVKQVENRFGRAYAKLSTYGSLARDPLQAEPAAPGTVFIYYSDLSEAEIGETVEPIAALAGFLSRVPAQLASEQRSPEPTSGNR